MLKYFKDIAEHIVFSRLAQWSIIPKAWWSPTELAKTYSNLLAYLHVDLSNIIICHTLQIYIIEYVQYVLFLVVVSSTVWWYHSYNMQQNMVYLFEDKMQDYVYIHIFILGTSLKRYSICLKAFEFICFASLCKKSYEFIYLLHH